MSKNQNEHELKNACSTMHNYNNTDYVSGYDMTIYNYDTALRTIHVTI